MLFASTPSSGLHWRRSKAQFGRRKGRVDCGPNAPLVQQLADRLRGIDVSSIAYFHADHFEPWRPIGNGPAVGPAVVESIHDFCRATERIDFARRLTLFYKPHLNYALRRGEGLIRADPDDLVGFLPRSDHEERCGREAMRGVVATTAHDIQLHIHHEYYTATTAHTDPAVIEWFASPLGRALDARRLELAIRLNREIIERETGRASARWFFVHGHWSLNASDDTSCTIVDEIDVLLRNGCRGDFTFPAGRQHTNPRIKVPYLCSPYAQPKGYDRPEAAPEIACGNAVAARDKFFIWNSPTGSGHSSLDYMSASVRRHLEDAERTANELLDTAYVADRRLYIKNSCALAASVLFRAFSNRRVSASVPGNPNPVVRAVRRCDAGWSRRRIPDRTRSI